MSTKAGVGFSNNTNSKEAGAEAAKKAMQQAGATECDLAIIYSTSKHDPAQVRDGIRSVLGSKANMIGGYAVGIITKDQLSYGGYELGVAIVSSKTAKFNLFSEKGLGTGGELQVGTKLGQQIKSSVGTSDGGILLMYDSVRGQNANLLNMATPLLQGMNEGLSGKWPTIAGVGLLGDMQFQPTKQWFNDQIETQTAAALTFSGGVRMDTVIMHGCKPAGGYHKITKTDGAVILEIDGMKATDMIGKLLGPDSDKTWEDYPLFVTLGVNKGDKFGAFNEENYANRLCMAVDKERGGLVMFEPDLKAGDEVQLMRRNIDFSYIGQRAKDLFDRIGSRKPFLAIYIDCAGRASAYCGSEREEAEEVQKIVGSKVPLLGMYSGVEVAKVGKDIQPLDWTGVLCVLSEP
ncbi:MAG: FIST signal transduction protein [Pseudobdellovibrionaceae bacterium]